ncbi:oxidoreductase [Sarocladium strictum]
MPFDNYNPDEDIPDLSGKTIFITGGTGGIAREAITQLAKHSPSQIFFTGRNTEAANSLLALTSSSSTTVTFLKCDPHSLRDVQAAAQRFLQQAKSLDIFIANLGIHSEQPLLTKDGYEINFGLSHLSHAAYLKAFLPLMLKTAEKPGSDVRYIAVTSQGTLLHPKQGIDFTSVKNANAFDWTPPLGGSWTRYGQSKLANVLFAKELARRHPSITSFAVHPGVVETDFVKNLSWKFRTITRMSQIGKGGTIQPADGACNPMWAATSPDVKRRLEQDEGVAWYEPVGLVAKGDAMCHNEKLAKELWDWSMKELDGLNL